MSSKLSNTARHSSKDLRHHLVRKIAIAMAGILTFIVSGGAFAWHDLQNQVQTVSVDHYLDAEDRPTQTEIPDDDYEGSAVNILVLGIDSRSGDNAVDGYEDDYTRSDTAMIVHISADRERIDVISIPRDTLVDIPSCTMADGTTTYAQSSAMFNTAFTLGAGDGQDAEDLAAGAACTIKTVEQLTGVYINEYVIVDFSGLMNMVDALGGVSVYVDEAIDDPDNTGLTLDVGCHKLNGEDALSYARVRHGVGDGSDLSRIERQQNFMAAMVRTAQNKNLLTNIDDLYAFAQAALGTLTTSPNIGSLTTMAGLASSAAEIGLDNINFVTMPYAEAPSDANRVVPAYNASLVWSALVDDTEIPSDIESSSADGSSSDDETDTDSDDSSSSVATDEAEESQNSSTDSTNVQDEATDSSAEDTETASAAEQCQ